jgi:SAM-dependent methyltransferase
MPTDYSECAFCGEALAAAYTLNRCKILRCGGCGCFRVAEMPTERELQDFYDGFLFQATPSTISRVMVPRTRDWMAGYVPASGGRMLDVGGGGGFFAAAFERFGLGDATYVDIDPQACEFASSTMGLSRVICGGVKHLAEDFSGQLFDFIYCRHVIEHLIDPVDLIRSCASLLSPSGALVLQCPCGTSKECIMYPRHWWEYLRAARQSNNWGLAYSWVYSLGAGYGWALDPPRHLWAISSKALKRCVGAMPGFRIRTFTASVADPLWSPYWNTDGVRRRAVQWVSQRGVGVFVQGAHLIGEVRRDSCAPHGRSQCV